MRTTINLDADAYNRAKAYASSHRLSLSEAVSRLILRKPNLPEPAVNELGFPQFRMNRIYTAEQIQGIIHGSDER